jgi:hypothetical protein
LAPDAIAYALDRTLPVPELAAFNNTEIVHRSTLASLLSAREHLRRLRGAHPAERDYFTLGLRPLLRISLVR